MFLCLLTECLHLSSVGLLLILVLSVQKRNPFCFSLMIEKFIDVQNAFTRYRLEIFQAETEISQILFSVTRDKSVRGIHIYKVHW